MPTTDSDLSLTKTLNTITININGLNNDNKRMEFFQILINKNFDIVFVQEHILNLVQLLKWKKSGKENPYSSPDPFQKLQRSYTFFKTPKI